MSWSKYVSNNSRLVETKKTLLAKTTYKVYKSTCLILTSEGGWTCGTIKRKSRKDSYILIGYHFPDEMCKVFKLTYGRQKTSDENNSYEHVVQVS